MQLMPWPNSQSEYSLLLSFAGHNQRSLGMKSLWGKAVASLCGISISPSWNIISIWSAAGLNPGLPHVRRVFQSPGYWIVLVKFSAEVIPYCMSSSIFTSSAKEK